MFLFGRLSSIKLTHRQISYQSRRVRCFIESYNEPSPLNWVKIDPFFFASISDCLFKRCILSTRHHVTSRETFPSSHSLLQPHPYQISRYTGTCLTFETRCRLGTPALAACLLSYGQHRKFSHNGDLQTNIIDTECTVSALIRHLDYIVPGIPLFFPKRT